jgi:hypothetical protein
MTLTATMTYRLLVVVDHYELLLLLLIKFKFVANLKASGPVYCICSRVKIRGLPLKKRWSCGSQSNRLIPEWELEFIMLQGTRR